MQFEAKLPDDSVNVSESSSLREAAILLGGVAGLALALTVGVALLIEIAIPLLPAKTEVLLFATLRDAFETSPSEGPIDDRAERTQALLDRMARRWSDSPYERFQVRIVADPEINAFAFPGGVVVVTSGLLDRIGSENELAFILGHELGHFAGRDHLRGIGRQLALTATWRLLGLGRDESEGLVGVLGGLAARGFDRQQESRADDFGLRLLVAEYGHAGGVREVFDRVLKSASPVDGRTTPSTEPGGEADREKGALFGLSAYWSTHPLGAERTRSLQDRIRESGWSLDGERTSWPAKEAVVEAR